MTILVIVPEPDERGSSDHLRELVTALHRRDGVEVAVWFLRIVDVPSWWGPAREVDALRTGLLGRIARLFGARIALGFQGVRLRRWMWQLDPDVVVLDDGHGGRIVPYAPRAPIVVVRPNPGVLPRAHLEPPARDDGDIVLWPALHPDDRPAADNWMRTPPLLAPARTFGPERHAVEEARLTESAKPIRKKAVEAVAELRAAVGGHGEPVVVGWGDDGWLDGPDLFVRALWFLEDRHGIRAHGVWIGLADSPEWRQRLETEADRCGVSDRLHLLVNAATGLEWGGDAAFLPSRVPVDPEVLLDCGAAGQPVVTFAPSMIDALWVHEVPVLDVEGAAAALAEALRSDHDVIQRELDVDLWVDSFVTRLRRLTEG